MLPFGVFSFRSVGAVHLVFGSGTADCAIVATYIIRGDVDGQNRLEVLARVMWPTASRLCIMRFEQAIRGSRK